MDARDAVDGAAAAAAAAAWRVAAAAGRPARRRCAAPPRPPATAGASPACGCGTTPAHYNISYKSHTLTTEHLLLRSLFFVQVSTFSYTL